MISPSDIIIDASEALAIWKIFRSDQLSVRTFQRLEYRAFMQACLMAAQEASAAMSWIEAAFRSAYKPNATVQGILIGLGKRALQKYYQHLVEADQELYQTVVTTIAWSHGTYFSMIANGMDL
jgi:tellurite resistance protein